MTSGLVLHASDCPTSLPETPVAIRPRVSAQSSAARIFLFGGCCAGLSCLLAKQHSACRSAIRLRCTEKDAGGMWDASQVTVASMSGLTCHVGIRYTHLVAAGDCCVARLTEGNDRRELRAAEKDNGRTCGRRHGAGLQRLHRSLACQSPMERLQAHDGVVGAERQAAQDAFGQSWEG